MKNTVYFVVPCYNEEAVLPETEKRLVAMMEQLILRGLASPESRILFVDDGSRDKTWRLITDFSGSSELVGGVKLSRNCGHQNALLAGLMTAKEHADAVISLDADLQDDIAVLPEFVKKWQEGCEIVYGVRKSRDTDTTFKRNTARMFYRFMHSMGVPLVSDHADYRLMSRRAVEELSHFREVNLFLRGIMPLIGFRTGMVYYERHERFAGESKYPLKKMLAFALDGITSFSTAPLQWLGVAGGIMVLAGLIQSIVALATQGAVLVLSGAIWLVGGLLMLGLRICGEYIGKTYKEVKDRPRYIIEQVRIHN